MRSVTIMTALAALLTCPAWAQQPDASPGDLAPLAQVGERILTTRDVDARWQADSPIEHGQAKQALYDGRRAALDSLVADLLLDKAAQADGATREEYES